MYSTGFQATTEILCVIYLPLNLKNLEISML